jgi:hypothetical protein
MYKAWPVGGTHIAGLENSAMPSQAQLMGIIM